MIVRLLPALTEMRRRHGFQGSRNDLNRRLGLPRKAGWEEYLTSRGLKPNTVRSWFQRFKPAQSLNLLVSGGSSQRESAQRGDVQYVKTEGDKPTLFQAFLEGRKLIVAATTAKQAVATLMKNGIAVDGVEELGQIVEMIGGRIHPVAEPEEPVVTSDVVILKALSKADVATVARLHGISSVTVRRIATKHRQRLHRG